jgi:hypothetical protein
VRLGSGTLGVKYLADTGVSDEKELEEIVVLAGVHGGLKEEEEEEGVREGVRGCAGIIHESWVMLT